jgi:hypothetical protein
MNVNQVLEELFADEESSDEDFSSEKEDSDSDSGNEYTGVHESCLVFVVWRHIGKKADITIGL